LLKTYRLAEVARTIFIENRDSIHRVTKQPGENMRRTTYFSISLLACLWMLDGCGSQNKNTTTETKKPSSPKSTYDCNAHQSLAGKRLREVVDAHLNCSTDADCISISLGTTCSDQCATSINQEWVKMFLPAAILTINAEVCAGYTEANCKLIHPPCAPPRPPACISGMCQ
jgi:hypothetical protein